MVSLATETDRTLFFDLLPLEVGKVAGFHTRIQLYTVPGQVFYNSTRRLVLKGVDGIVFVADSQPAMLPSNVESFRNLEVNLAELGIKIDEIPLVLQYNKRDLPEVCSAAELSEALNTNNWPEFETSALAGTGIFEVLREISKLTLISLKKQLEDGVPDPPRPTRPAPAAAAPEPTPPPELAPPPDLASPPENEAPVAAATSEQEPEADAENEVVPEAPPAAAMSDDDIEDSALAQLGSEEAAGTVAAEAASKQDATTEATDAVELDPAQIAATNGRGKMDRALNLAMRASDLERAFSLSLDLQVRDESNRVLHQVRDFEWSLQDIDRLQDVLLNLKIELESEDT